MPSEYTWAHVTCPKTCLKVSQLWRKITPKTWLIWLDGQWGLLVYPLSLQKTYVTSPVKFSTLRVYLGLLTLLITVETVPSLTPSLTQWWSLGVATPTTLWSDTGSRDGWRTSQTSSQGETNMPVPASCHQGGWWVICMIMRVNYYQDFKCVNLNLSMNMFQIVKLKTVTI